MEGVDAAFAFHNMPFLPLGAIGGTHGTIMAGTATFHVVFHGRGGHAAMPHGNVDPIPPAAQFITAVQVLLPVASCPRLIPPGTCMPYLRSCLASSS